MRETVRSLSAVDVGNLRGVASSKELLLRRVIYDDNAANNGGILSALNPLIAIIANGSCDYGTIHLRTRTK